MDEDGCYEGVLIRDKELLDRYGEDKEEGLVLGGIVPSEEVKAFLRLPPKFRTYGKVKERDFRINAETAAAKQRFAKKSEEGVWRGHRSLRKGDLRKEMRGREEGIRYRRGVGLILAN